MGRPIPSRVGVARVFMEGRVTTRPMSTPVRGMAVLEMSTAGGEVPLRGMMAAVMPQVGVGARPRGEGDPVRGTVPAAGPVRGTGRVLFLPIQDVAFFTVDQADHPALNHHAVEADCRSGKKPGVGGFAAEDFDNQANEHGNAEGGNGKEISGNAAEDCRKDNVWKASLRTSEGTGSGNGHGKIENSIKNGRHNGGKEPGGGVCEQKQRCNQGQKGNKDQEHQKKEGRDDVIQHACEARPVGEFVAAGHR